MNISWHFRQILFKLIKKKAIKSTDSIANFYRLKVSKTLCL